MARWRVAAGAGVAAGRGDDAVRWLEDAVQNSPQLYPRWPIYAAPGAIPTRRQRTSALKISLRSVDLRIRYAGMLLGTGVEKDAVRARDVLREAVEMRAPDDRTLERALLPAGAGRAAHRRARRFGADGSPRHSQNRRNPRAYVALAETLEERHKYQDVADVLAPAVTSSGATRSPKGPCRCCCRTSASRTSSSASSTRRSRRSRKLTRSLAAIPRSPSI